MAGEPFDLFLQLCYGRVHDLRRMMTKHGSMAVLVAGYNVGWGYRPEKLPILAEHADHVVFNNFHNWERWRQPHTTCIMNGVDRDVFYTRVPAEQRPPRVLWTGSFYHNGNNNKKTEFIKAMATKDLKKMRFNFDFEGSKIVLNMKNI